MAFPPLVRTNILYQIRGGKSSDTRGDSVGLQYMCYN
nr:MAG TPA: hypothetical protein [Caudoviricetes sp.]